MPSTLPPGDPAPDDGALPAAALDRLGRRPFGFYVHVPFCASRCGYCDFNTYTSAELPGVNPSSYGEWVAAEVMLARRVLGDRDLPVETVFVGGGTPTLLAPAQLTGILSVIDGEFGLAPGAEVTTEANPESVDERSLTDLRAGGFNRISFGMQSAREHVLAVLERAHSPAGAVRAVAQARAAGFEQINVDLIYGAPGESDDDWRASLDAAVGSGVDHVSAYALIVEDGTRFAARIRRGELPGVDDDTLADRYAIADETLAAAGLTWYEVSNWARAGAACRHNLGYWRSDDWWGAGPGAHSHVGGVRWWNAKHPASYGERLAAGRSPAHAREWLAPAERAAERVLLETRLATGLDVGALGPTGRGRLAALVQDGLITPDGVAAGRVTLTARGRLLADAVVRDLVE